MNKLDNDCVSKLIQNFVDVSNFNPILKLVNLKFNFLFEKNRNLKQRKWKKNLMYNEFIQPVYNGWKKFINTWDNEYEITETQKSYNYDRILNNYCQLYIIKNLVCSQCKILIDFYSAYPKISKHRKKIIESIGKEQMISESLEKKISDFLESLSKNFIEDHK